MISIGNSSLFLSSVDGNGNVLNTENANRNGKTKNRTWEGKRTRARTKCKECYKNRNSRRRDKIHRGEKPSILERDQIRKIMEKVAEEILAGNAHSSDDFHGEKTSIISVSYNSKDQKHKPDNGNGEGSSKKISSATDEDEWSTGEDSNRYDGKLYYYFNI